ncbi:MAG: HlyD family efflux transporter periplasmic adaptor subunit [Woeseiaceae bacterium]|nr:HlyD family efflux transporter periplasmic adaptor subunit [Woeseiaceae bacterium]
MSDGLFRSRAVAARAAIRHGECSLSQPPGYRVFTLFALAAAFAVLLLLWFGHYTQKVTVAGHVTTTHGNVRVYPQGRGVVTRVAVREGQRVPAGATLLEISTARRTRGADVDAAVIATLKEERAELGIEAARSQELYAAAQAALAGRLANDRTQLDLLAEQVAVAGERLALHAATLRRTADMVTAGHLPRADLPLARGRYLDHKLALGALQRELARQRATIAATVAEQRELPLRRDSRRAEIDAAMQRVARDLAAARGRRAQLVVAPLAGRVSGLAARAGATVTPARPVMALLPDSARYYVELVVPGRAVGFVRPGAAVRLRIDAYPHRSFGTLGGVVADVARSVVQPGDVAMPVPVREASYLVRVRLDAQALVAGAERLPLRAGMTVAADVLRDRRRLIEWLFVPGTGGASQ